jgi:diaminopimelate epimerase
MFDVNDNIIGIFLLNNVPTNTDIQSDVQLRDYLCNWGRKYSIDSIAVIRQDSKLRFIDVFEPNFDLHKSHGIWSTMCGNGLIALGTFLHSESPSVTVFNIQTGSGMRSIYPKHKSIMVEMGRLSYSSDSFSNFIKGANSTNLIDIPIPSCVQKSIKIQNTKWSFGMVGDQSQRGVIFGEPHCVIFVNNVDTISKLREVAMENGRVIMQNTDLFPYGMNINFLVIKNINYKSRSITLLSCTYERNLGSDPNICVTGACGTGSVSSFGVLLTLAKLSGDWKAEIRSPGGITKVERKKDCYSLLSLAKLLKKWS